MSKQDWYEALKSFKANPYIKPNRLIHDSGFRCFEVGYCILGNDNRVREKLVLNRYSDHIQLYQYFKNNLFPNLDLTLDGYIRIYPIEKREGNYWWGSMDFVVSSAQIRYLDDDKQR